MHIKGRKKENVLFNNALFTFYLMLYGEHYGTKPHSGSFICTIPDRIVHTMAFVILVEKHCLE